jgi:preprotein translocase subunit SecG
MLRVILTIVQVFSSLAIIGLVLLQRGKGADAGAGFGAGASGTVFGARGASTALSRATAIFAAIFMLNSLMLTYMGTHSAAAQPKSILDTAAEQSTGKGSAAQGANKPGLTPAPTNPAPASSGSGGTAGAGATAPMTPAPTNSAPAATTPPPAATSAPAAPASAPTQPAPPNGAPPK